MISSDTLRRLANFVGVPADVELHFENPGSSNDWAHEMRIVRGAVLLRKRFLFGQPSAGEIAEALRKMMDEHEWLRAEI